MGTKKIIMPEIVSIGVYNASIAHKNKTVSPTRKTTMFELELPFGEGGVSFVNNTQQKISRNMIICAKPGQLRHTKLPFTCYYIHAIVNEGSVFDTLSILPDFIDIPAESFAEIKGVFVSICEQSEDGSSENEMLIGSLFLKLVHILSKIASPRKMHTPKANNREAVEKTITFIKNNLTAELSLEALASEVKFSPVYFHRLFKASTGKTLRCYVEEQRIKKAVDLLVSTDLSLTEIAYECGFSSQSYFSCAFKKRMGLTPRDYARSILSKYGDRHLI